jgi:serine/threonine protein kinase
MVRKGVMVSYKQTGGNAIGSGGFGEIFDSITDITNATISDDMVKMYEPNEHGFSFESLKSIVFKQLDDDKEYYEEEANNTIVRKHVKPLTLTSLHETVKSVMFKQFDGVLVYSKFDNNLENFLYTRRGGRSAEWKRNTIHLKPHDFIKNVMSQLLKFCVCIHKINYIHSDIKLDNILVRNSGNDIVLADYGLLTNIDDRRRLPIFDDEHLFYGMVDYMPPFCHFVGLKDQDVLCDYGKRMKYIFQSFKDSLTNHPPVQVEPVGEQVKDEFFSSIALTYKKYGSPEEIDQSNKFKIDLHPIGIILLQLLYFFKGHQDLNYIEWHAIAMKLLENNNETATKILVEVEAVQKVEVVQKMAGGGRKKVLILGRMRLVHQQGRKKFVNVQGNLVSLKEAKLKEKDLKKKM